MKWTLVVVGVLSGVGVTSPVHGAIMYLSQQRSITANGARNNITEGAGLLSASGFGTFNQTLTHIFSQGAGTATASQLSMLGPETIRMDGFASVTANPAMASSFFGESYSRFAATFRLDAATPFQVEHSHSSGGAPGQRIASAQLVGPTGSVFDWFVNSNAADSWPISPFSGFLPAGDYTLSIQSYAFRNPATGGFGTTTATVAVVVTIPAPQTLGVLAWCGVAVGRMRPRRRRITNAVHERSVSASASLRRATALCHRF